MNDYIVNRVKEEAKYIIETHDTIRKIALKFGVSKSTVHKDLQERLPIIDLKTHQKVEEILNYHIKIRHLRGGESTKKKYLKSKEKTTN